MDTSGSTPKHKDYRKGWVQPGNIKVEASHGNFSHVGAFFSFAEKLETDLPGTQIWVS